MCLLFCQVQAVPVHHNGWLYLDFFCEVKLSEEHITHHSYNQFILQVILQMLGI